MLVLAVDILELYVDMDDWKAAYLAVFRRLEAENNFSRVSDDMQEYRRQALEGCPKSAMRLLESGFAEVIEVVKPENV